MLTVAEEAQVQQPALAAEQVRQRAAERAQVQQVAMALHSNSS